MSVIVNDNFSINVGKPADSKYLNGQTPWVSIAAVNAGIPLTYRYTGLTVNILGVEYWYATSTANAGLVEKKYDSIIPSADFVTGGTNIGYFSGFTGVQILPIDHQTISDYDGNYYSLYNYYYRGTDGKIHTGMPSDGILKRGYAKRTGTIKSWIWNEYTGAGNLLGWILIDGNIEDQIGTFQNGVTYYGSSTSYIQTSWSGTPPANGSLITINTVIGSLTTGSTYYNGGNFYSKKTNKLLNIKTLESKTPNLIKVTSDESFVYLSGTTTTITASNIGSGVGVYSAKVGDNIELRKICGAGSITVTQVGDSIRVSGATGSGGSGGLYNLASPAVVSVGGILSGTTLTGKTAFELFEELLVPTQYPTLTTPTSVLTVTPSTTVYEVGCVIGTLCFTNTFNAGCINPQYTATCDKRSNGVNLYCYTGAQIAGSVSCTAGSLTQCATSYAILYGTQSWGGCSHYDAGVQPKDSKGNNYCSPLTPDATLASTVSLTGIYPYYYGKVTAGSRPAVTNSLVTGGTKCVADSTGTINIDYDSVSSEYTWVAIPATSTSKTCWYVNGFDNGYVARGCASDKYPDECTISVCSKQGCWTGISYKVYMSGTVGTNTDPIQFRNS